MVWDFICIIDLKTPPKEIFLFCQDQLKLKLHKQLAHYTYCQAQTLLNSASFQLKLTVILTFVQGAAALKTIVHIRNTSAITRQYS